MPGLCPCSPWSHHPVASSSEPFLQSFVVSVVPSVVEPESQRLRELRQPQCHQGKDPAYLSVWSSFTEGFRKDVRSFWKSLTWFLHCGKEIWCRVFVPLQPTPTSKFLQGYAGAVTSAVSIAVSELHQHYCWSTVIMAAFLSDSDTFKDTFP